MLSTVEEEFRVYAGCGLVFAGFVPPGTEIGRAYKAEDLELVRQFLLRVSGEMTCAYFGEAEPRRGWATAMD